MVKKKNKLILTWVIIILILSVVTYFGIRTITQQTLFAPGYTVNSISPDIKIFAGQVTPDSRFVVTITLDGGANQIVGEISPEGFKQETDYLTKAPLKFDVTAIDEKLDYKIVNDKIPIYKYIDVVISDPIFGSAGPCPSDPINGVETIYSVDFIGYDKHCIVRERGGLAGHLTNPTIKNQATLKLTVNNQVLTQTISNEQNTVARFVESSGKERATAKVVGLLITGDPVPRPGVRIPYYTPLNGWSLALDSEFNSYTSQQSNIETIVRTYDKELDFPSVRSCGTKTFDECITKTFNNVLSGTNSASTTLTNSRRNMEGLSSTAYLNKNDLENALIRIDSDRKIGNAQIVLQVDATWLGIVLLQGKPNIKSLTCPAFNSGEEGFMIATVENKANSQANFEFAVSNCDPFQATFSTFTNTYQFTPYEVKEVKINLNPSTAVETKKTCTLTVKDIGSFGANQDSDTVVCEVKVPLQCTPNTQALSGNCVNKCKADGSGYERLLCCKENELPRAIEGKFPTEYQCPSILVEICDDKRDNDNDGLIDSDDPDCGGEFCKDEVTLAGVTILPDFGSRPREGFEKVIGFFAGLFGGSSDTITCTSLIGYVKWIVALIVFIASLILLTTTFIDLFKKSIKGLRKKEGLNILISFLLALVIASLLYFLIYKIFILAIVIFIVIIIIKVALKSFTPFKGGK